MEVARTRAMTHQDLAEVVHGFDDHVNHFAFPLQMTGDDPCGAAAAHLKVFFPGRWVDNQVGLAGLVFQRHESDTFGSPGALPHDDNAGQFDGRFVCQTSEFGAGLDRHGV